MGIEKIPAAYACQRRDDAHHETRERQPGDPHPRLLFSLRPPLLREQSDRCHNHDARKDLLKRLPAQSRRQPGPEPCPHNASDTDDHHGFPHDVTVAPVFVRRGHRREDDHEQARAERDMGRNQRRGSGCRQVCQKDGNKDNPASHAEESGEEPGERASCKQEEETGQIHA